MRRDGTAVLGLGDIGPEAALPMMEGKAMLFREFAGVDAFPICLATKNPDEIVETVKLIAPAFGGINLEDIAAPNCFEIEQHLHDELNIPVFHDDQHGTAVVLTAALINALKIVDKKPEELRVVVAGVGAAGVYGSLSRTLRMRGEVFGSNDIWIATTALSQSCPLLTRNAGHFSRVPDLDVVTNGP